MNILTSGWRGDITTSVSEYVARELQHTDPDSGGVVEDAAMVAGQTACAVGKLMDVLASKGLLSAIEVTDIVCGYALKTPKFVD